MAFVADVNRSIAYYRHLGFQVRNTFAPPGADGLNWAWLESAGGAALMVSRATGPIDPEQQAVLFYLYVDDVAAAHQEVTALGLKPSPIGTPFYAPKGEFRLTDPDGYTLMMMHT